MISRFNALHGAILAAGDGGWPHLSLLGTAPDLSPWVEARRAAGERLVVLGEPGAVSACRALLPGGAPMTPVFSPGGLVAALAGDVPVHLMTLQGPRWVRDLAVEARPSVRSATWVGRDDAPAEFEHLVGASDARFGVLGPGSLAVAALAGVGPELLLAEAERMARRCAGPALFENPAYVWAALLGSLADRGVERLTFLLPDPALQPWSDWAARCWAGTTARVVGRSGVQTHRGLSVHSALVGDENLLQLQLAGPRDALVVSVTVDDPGPSVAQPLGLRAWELGRALQARQVRQLTLDGRPVIQLRLPSLQPAWLASLSFLSLHTAVVVALFQDADPLVQPVVDHWRALTGEP